MEFSISNTQKKILLLSCLMIVIYLTFRFLLPLTVPFVFAGVVSVLYYPFLRKAYDKIFPNETETSTTLPDKKSEHNKRRKKRIFLMIAVGLFYVLILLLAALLFGYLWGQVKSLLLNLPFYQAKCMVLLKDCCCKIDNVFHIREGASYAYIQTTVGDNWSNSGNAVLLKATGYSMQLAKQIFSLLFSIVITIIATFFMIQEYDDIRAFLLNSEAGRNVCRMVQKCKETLKAYVKAQGLIMVLDGTVCTLAFWIIGQPYFLILGLVVAIVDALPVLGAGLILLPYALLLLLSKELGHAVILLFTYAACVGIRQVTEPKIISGKVGIKPLYTIAGMYVGFKLFGVFGFLLGPIGLLIIKEAYQNYL